VLSSLIHDLEDVEKLSELGVLFLLFEMGLELSLDRLKVREKAGVGVCVDGYVCVWAGVGVDVWRGAGMWVDV